MARAEHPRSILAAGTAAPDFTLHTTCSRTRTRSQSRTWSGTPPRSASTPADSSPSFPTGSTPRAVHEDFRSGILSGVNGTPTFFINGARHNGAFDPETLGGAIEDATASR